MKKLILACWLSFLFLSSLTGLNAAGDDFVVGMECNYPPFNWSTIAAGDTSVRLDQTTYCDGYDVAIARYIANGLNRNLVVKALAWEGLEPALSAGEIDAIIAGMTDTPERRKNAEFTAPYYESEMVMIVLKDGPYASASSIQDFSGARVLGQVNTTYDEIIDQIEGVIHMEPLQSYPFMIVSLLENEVDGLTAELPVALGTIEANSNLSIVRFEPDQGFDGDTTVSVAVKKGNLELKDEIDAIIAEIDIDQRNELMLDATLRQPANEETSTSGLLVSYWPLFLSGVKNTLLISLTATFFGLLIGLLVGGIRAIKVEATDQAFTKFIKQILYVITTIYIEVFRGTPMIVQSMFIYYGLKPFFGWTPLLAGIIIVSINTGAYMSEIIRSGIQSISLGQSEAARALGMSPALTMRHIILPQALKNAFPSIGNEVVVNIKDTSVLNVIAVSELYSQSVKIAGTEFMITKTFFITALIYLFLTLVTTQILRAIEYQLTKTKSSYPASQTIVDHMNIERRP